jgi:hypothetical protein
MERGIPGDARFQKNTREQPWLQPVDCRLEEQGEGEERPVALLPGKALKGLHSQSHSTFLQQRHRGIMDSDDA